jgi:hypothetical protein
MTIVWTLWLLVLIASFAAFEGYALKTGRTTLSRYVWTISEQWPPFGWVCGVIVGGLAAHFWWIAQDCPGVK